MAHSESALPLSIVGPIDIGRLIRELESINDALLQLKLRKSGQNVKLPKTTMLLDQLVNHFKINLLNEDERTQLLNYLMAVKEESPVLHVSFSADPSPAFLEKLIAWFRREVHPQLLLTIGLQPAIGAGCIIRGYSRIFDLSLKQSFIDKRQILMSKLIPASLTQSKPATTEVREEMSNE